MNKFFLETKFQPNLLNSLIGTSKMIVPYLLIRNYPEVTTTKNKLSGFVQAFSQCNDIFSSTSLNRINRRFL